METLNNITKLHNLLLLIKIIAFLILPFIFFITFFGILAPICKPAVYLYPPEDSFVSVKLHINGILTKDIPKYTEGWSVFVTKEGMINSNYDYLFYEARLFPPDKTGLSDEGWIVSYKELEPWFDSTLPKLGMNEKEKSQFKKYWLNKLPQSNYYEIKLFNRDFLDNNMGLEIEPKPETVIRLIFYFKPLDKNIDISTPDIITPERKGFTVVEWGGTLG